MAIIAATEFPSVRRVLDTSLTSDDLPDTVIADAVYQGSAEAWAKRRDPSWASRAGDELIALKTSVILMTAALLAPAIPRIASASMPDLTYSLVARIDWDELASRLAARADTEVLALAGAAPTARHFLLAGRARPWAV